MRVIINTEDFYKRLNSPTKNQAEEMISIMKSMADKGYGDDVKPILNLDVLSDHVNLPSPFRYAYLSFHRRGDIYRCELLSYYFFNSRLSSEIPKKLITEILPELYKSNWVALNENSGMLVQDKKTIMSINSDINNPLIIVMGGDGAERRKFGKLEEFVGDLAVMGQVAEKAINALVNNYGESNPDIDLHFVPDINRLH
ncbi:hypothetical protein COU61_03020 [Candidatus Pacearchaeota archaeon CG10_big_fil_rev_8_21_14_0_10_35_13]|nr:MAG: hypothetical protein COU61_03020 [Candidatus Pacearchaeota archaeon CG10_big_fil_rev_8_21_14_0_10_35_13]